MSLHRHNPRRDANEGDHLNILSGLKVFNKRMDPIVPGWPDSLAVVCGVPHFPEFKTKDGRLTPAQLDLRQQLSNAGIRLEAFFPVLVTPDETIAWVAQRRAALWKQTA